MRSGLSAGQSIRSTGRAGARAEDFVFEGYELEDALERANETLEDDTVVSEADGSSEKVRPFTRQELLRPLERWFFGRP